MNKDGTDVKSIARYGSDGKKICEIHTTDLKGIGEHFHKWNNCKSGEP